MDFTSLLRDWNNHYYIIPIMCIIEFTTITFGLLHLNGDKLRLVFTIYLIVDFCILITGFYVLVDPWITKENHKAFFRNTNVIIAFVEISTYYYFFNLILQRKFKLLLLILFLIYLICIFIYFSETINLIASTPIHGANIVSALEFCLLLPPCFLYFRQLFKTSSPLKLTKRPTFWIVSGIFFFSLISIPYYLLMSYFVQSGYQYRTLLSSAFYYFPFTINFIFILKAFLCKKPLMI